MSDSELPSPATPRPPAPEQFPTEQLPTQQPSPLNQEPMPGYFPAGQPPLLSGTPTPTRPILGIMPRLWGEAALTGIVGYLAGFILSVFITVGFAATLSASSSADGELSLWRVPFHLSALAVFGQVNAGDNASTVGEFSLLATPLTITTAMILGITLWIKRVSRRSRVTPQNILVLSTVTAITMALVTIIFAAAFPLQGGGENARYTFGAASPSAFFGAFAIAFLVSWITWTIRSGVLTSWVQRFPALSLGSVRIASIHLLMLTGIFAFLTLIIAFVALFDELFSFFAVLAFLGNIASALTLLGNLGAISISGMGSMSGIGGSETESLSIFTDNAPGLLYILPVVAVIALVFAALLLAARRVYRRPTTVSWAWTIGSYMMFGLLFHLAILIHASTSGISIFSVSVSASIGPEPWTFLLFGLWGLAVEVLARFVMPRLVVSFSPSGLRFLHRLSGVDHPRLVPMMPHNQGVPNFADAPNSTLPVQSVPSTTQEVLGVPPYPDVQQPYAFQHDPSSTAQVPGFLPASGAPTLAQGPQPLSPRARKRLKWGFVVGGGAVVLIIALVVGLGAIRTSVYGPQVVAKNYLTALSEGKASDALALLGESAPDPTGLFTDEAFGKATDRITGISVGEVTTTDDRATVEVSYKQYNTRRDVTLELLKTGSSNFIADKWVIDNADFSTIELSGPTDMAGRVATLGGKEIGKLDDYNTLSIKAFPGTYTMEFAESDFFKAETVVAQAKAVISEDLRYAVGEAIVTVNASPNENFISEVERIVDEKIDECVAKTSLSLDNCPFDGASMTYYIEPEKSNPKYSLVQKPKISLGLKIDEWVVITEEPGEVLAEWDYTAWDGSVERVSKPRDITINAIVQIDDGTISLKFD